MICVNDTIGRGQSSVSLVQSTERSIMSEDDTFRKLSQKPFDVVANNLRVYKGVDSDFIIKCYGWTVEEYAREWEHRNPWFFGG
jgi:hypothetical protein